MSVVRADYKSKLHRTTAVGKLDTSPIPIHLASMYSLLITEDEIKVLETQHTTKHKQFKKVSS